jgi:predicted DsbA family dithiol-disulfide isomerase
MKKGAILIDVWSDYVCPFCYLAEPTLAQVEQEFKKAVQITWRAFELRPDPVPTLDPNGEYLREIWARAVYPMAEQRGLRLRLPPMQPRSRWAHEAAAFARAQKRFAALHDALFRAFFEEGKHIGHLDTVVQLGETVGLNPEHLRRALREGRYRAGVLSDEATARELGLAGVPATLVRAACEPLERSIVVEGAQPYEAFQKAVTRVLDHAGRGGGRGSVKALKR